VIDELLHASGQTDKRKVIVALQKSISKTTKSKTCKANSSLYARTCVFTSLQIYIQIVGTQFSLEISLYFRL